MLQDFLSAAQPLNDYPSRFVRGAEAEVQPQIALRAETATAAQFLNLPPAFGFDNHSGSYRRAVGARSHKSNK
jgi:hypothetical protein